MKTQSNYLDFIAHNVVQLSNLFLQDLDKLRDFTSRFKI
jgi:hypothetical protein